MTQVERLIRNLCEEKRLQLVEARQAALRAVPEHLKIEKAPTAVKRAIARYRQAERTQQAMLKIVRDHGFHASGYDLNRVVKQLSLSNHGQRQNDVNARFESRQLKVKALRTDATVASLGKTAADAAPILSKLQADLAKV